MSLNMHFFLTLPLSDCRDAFVTENLFSNFLLGPLEKCGTCQKMKKCHILSERQKL